MGIHFFFIAMISFVAVLAMNPQVLAQHPIVYGAELQSFKIVWISIMLESLPFLLLGVFVSSLMQAFVPDAWITKSIPGNTLLAVLFAIALGIVFPVCECAMIPVVRRFIQKGMPAYIGIVFILAGPIVNPVVYAATRVAFPTRPEMVSARMGLALVIAVVIGLLFKALVRKNMLRHTAATQLAAGDGHVHQRQGGRISTFLGHASVETFDTGKYLLFGAALTALVQTFVPHGSLTGLAQNEAGSSLLMMGFAYVLSLCSTSDAFVASSFVTTFSGGALLSFLVFGPMLDFKSTLMLLAVFRTKYVLLLALLVAVFVFIGSLVIGQVYLW